MGDEFYAIIKLVSGEEIFSLLYVDENDGDPVIVLNSPLIIKSSQNENSVFFKVRPWIELSNESIFFIKLDKIITMTESRDPRLIMIYNRFIEDDYNDYETESGKVKVSKEMGYVSSVESARKKLEDIFKGL